MGVQRPRLEAEQLPKRCQFGLESGPAVRLRIRRADIFPVSPVNGILAMLGRRDHLVNPSLLRSLIESELPCQKLEEARIPCYVIATDVLTGAEIRPIVPLCSVVAGLTWRECPAW